MALPLIRAHFLLNGIAWGKNWRVFGLPILQRYAGSKIILGDNIELRSTVRSNPLAPHHPVVLSTRTAHATITIGDGTGLTGATVVAAERIEIGCRVLVGANAVIVDTDFHPLTVEGREKDINAGATSPIQIEDDVFIGTQALILKGVRLGEGCVIGAGSVVTRDVPAGMIAAGNPAKVVGAVKPAP